MKNELLFPAHTFPLVISVLFPSRQHALVLFSFHNFSSMNVHFSFHHTILHPTSFDRAATSEAKAVCTIIKQLQLQLERANGFTKGMIISSFIRLKDLLSAAAGKFFTE